MVVSQQLIGRASRGRQSGLRGNPETGPISQQLRQQLLFRLLFRPRHDVSVPLRNVVWVHFQSDPVHVIDFDVSPSVKHPTNETSNAPLTHDPNLGLGEIPDLEDRKLAIRSRHEGGTLDAISLSAEMASAEQIPGEGVVWENF